MNPDMLANPIDGCPGREVLVEFDRGRLPEPAIAALAVHLSSCERCEGVLHDLQRRTTEDGLVGLLKKCLRAPRLPDELAFAARETTSLSTLLSFDLADPIRRPDALRPGRGDDAAPRRSVGPYQLLDRIGQGGMGVVYRAEQVSLKRLVAVKMISAGHDASSHAVARFLREGKAIARLRHPNVVQVYDLGESEGLPYYAMELVDGESLQRRLSEGPMEPRAAAALVRTLAAAVEYAHQQGVIHRDLKPSNILMAGDGTPRIVDFGLAKLLDTEPDPDGPATARLTATEVILGTPSYMAPEQAEGRSAEIVRATDVYALGAVLYEALTGRPPFVGESKIKVLQLVRAVPPVPPSRVRPEVPTWLEAICLKCLEKAPARRYASAQALADDLDRWLRDERPRGIPGRLARLGRSLRRHTVAILVGLVPFSVGAGMYLHHPDRALEAHQRQLDLGRPVSLVGKSGKPRWYRWQAGESRSQLTLGDDGTCTIQSWSLGLVELLPDPRSDSYRLTAQIRHEKSNLTVGEVGLYFARDSYQGKSSRINFFAQVSFNAILRGRDLLDSMPDGIRKPRVADYNMVKMFTHINSELDDRNPSFIDQRVSVACGPRFAPLGEGNGRWHDLEVIVTLDGVRARWNGQSFSVETPVIEEYIKLHKTDKIPRAPGDRDVFPNYQVRGGLGLYVLRGSASFRAVSVTPLR